jgi:NADPH-dependent 7-cyano-7-deazaguanine reductase QueF-like protein
MKKSDRFPLANDVMKPVQDFKIGERILSLYFVTGRSPWTAYSLYWNDAPGLPLQHAMSDVEVFTVLHHLLEPEDA